MCSPSYTYIKIALTEMKIDRKTRMNVDDKTLKEEESSKNIIPRYNCSCDLGKILGL